MNLTIKLYQRKLKVVHLCADGTDLELFFLESDCHGKVLSLKTTEKKGKEKE